MSASVESAMEEEPLKEEPEEGVSSKSGCADGPCVSKLSAWRTAAFLFSLFLCLIVVFAFSFVLPCPVRPQYKRSWSKILPAAATYDFLTVGDANKDKVQDVFFIYKSAEGALNHTCVGEGLTSPCLFLLALDGTDGLVLWERPLASVFGWAMCGLGLVSTKGETCLVAHADNLTAVNIHTGEIVWQTPRSPVTDGRLPVILLPDLDRDGTNDIAVLSYSPGHTPAELVFFSGKSGEVIGSKVDVGAGQVQTHLQVTTPSGGQYLLLHTDTGLYALGVWRLARRAQDDLDTRLRKEPNWDKRSSDTGLISLHESRALQHVWVVKGGSGSSSPSVLLQTASTVMLLNTDTLTIRWTRNTSLLINVPSFGHYNKDRISDIVLEEDLGNSTKRVVILDGHTGRELWTGTLFFRTQSPAPASVFTIYYYSVFMLWGEIQTRRWEDGNNGTWATYLLHPLFSSVLLERRNPAQNIMSFKTVLLERGRHACYLVLSGADGTLTDKGGLAEAGPVVLTKRKIKDDVSESAVLGVAGAGGGAISTDEVDSLKEAFNRLRFNEDIV